MSSFNASVAYHRVTQVVFLIVLAGTAYGILGEDALPGSELFAVLALAICAYAGGLLVSYFRLPPLVGKYVFYIEINCHVKSSPICCY